MQMVAKLLFLSPVVSIVCWLSQEEVSIPVEMRMGQGGRGVLGRGCAAGFLCDNLSWCNPLFIEGCC